jgi:DNA-directed RNA polymerase subunit beta'
MHLGYRKEFVNVPGNKKSLEKLFKSIYNEIGPDDTCDILDRIKAVGLHYATLAGLTTSVDDFIIPENKVELVSAAEEKRNQFYNAYKNGFVTNNERIGLIEQTWNEVKDALGRGIRDHIRDYKSVGYIIESGARGNFENLLQITGMIGVIKSLTGRTMETPVKGSYIEGLNPLEYFLASYQLRKGMTDKNFKVPDAGYLTRRMCDVGQDLMITDEDCGTDEGVDLSWDDCNDSPISIDFGVRIQGRFTLKPFTLNGREVPANTHIDKELADEISKSDVSRITIRSPLSCKATGICQKCYGTNPAKGSVVNLGAAVGVVAATATGEPSAQLMLKAYHVDAVDVVQGFPRLEELLEGRSKIQSFFAHFDGVVSLQSTKGKDAFDITVTASDGEQQTFTGVSSNYVRVKSGQFVTKGTQLTLGSPNPHELYEVMGKDHTHKYILQEILKVFAAQGVTVKDVHIETLLRKMFAYCYVVDSGSTELIDGSYVSKETAALENDQIGEDGVRAEVQDVLLGISKAALSTDSFLSAASFEETTNILINSAIQSKVDYLTGLKENIMIGRLIPAGSGFQKEKVTKSSLNELEKYKID